MKQVSLDQLTEDNGGRRQTYLPDAMIKMALS